MISNSTVDEVRAAFDGLSEAWRRGDGAGFAAWCTEDVDFINVLGMYVKGRPAVEELHDKIFRGPYAGSTVAFTIESVRPVSPRSLIVIAPARVDIPAGAVQGMVSTIASVLFVQEPDGWKIASFHNTRREASQSNHGAVMRDAIEN
jgi:uncharacterized protein (TIGR02246 family)